MAKTHVTSQGEMWDSIAKAYYGDERQMSALLEANPDYQDTVVFSAGVALTIPEMVQQEIDLPRPPWEEDQ